MKTYKLRCEILSPVHIGSGQEIEPMNYIIENGRLYKISFIDFVSHMDDKQRREFEVLIDSGNLLEIRKRVAETVEKVRDSVYSIEVSLKIAELYRSKVSDIQNQLLISPFIRTEGGSVPFIPGSSLKGAIRTAIISEMAKKSKSPKPKDGREEYEFESKVLGHKDAKNDPFRAVKIRDVSLRNEDTIVRDVKNMSKKKGSHLQANNIQMICEVTHSAGSGRAVEFETGMLFDNELLSTKYLSTSISKEQIIKSCNDFYKDKVEQEHKKFYKGSEVEKYSEHLLNAQLNDNSFIVRVGRFSGVESVTLDYYRNPRPPGNKTTWGTSRNLAEGLYPMGWIKVTVSE